MMTSKREFKINDHLSLRLENGRLEGESPERDVAVIYVDGEEFIACHFLLLQFPEDKVPALNDLDSIDAAEELLSKKQERNPTFLSSEEEFFGHCSNLQAWYEHDYDTRLLHRNLAFPLLKKLTEAGDTRARKIFKEEVAKRLCSGHDTVVHYLLTEEYGNYLSVDEFKGILEGLDEEPKRIIESNIIKALQTTVTRHETKECLFSFFRALNETAASSLEHVEFNGEKFFPNNGKLEFHLTKDEKIKINDISDIKGLERLSNLKELDLNNQDIEELKGLGDLKDLEVLKLRNNKIVEIKGIERLHNLRELSIHKNKIKEMKGLDNLSNLEYLNLSENEIKEIKNLENLINLKSLFLRSNRIKKLENLEKLSRLETLHLGWNHIRIIEGIQNLKKLKELRLNGNNISEKQYKKIKWKNKEFGYIEGFNLDLMNQN